MPFLENLAEGFAGAAGDTGTVERIEKTKARREALSDYELQNQTNMILADVDALHQRRAALDPNSPTYSTDVQSIDQALHDARGVFTDLYHPEKNPGALSKLHGFIQQHITKRGQAPATPAAAKQSIAERMGGIESAAYGQSQPENPYTKLRRQLKEANPNMSEDDLNTAMRVSAGIEAKPIADRPAWKLYISPDGKDTQYYDASQPHSIPPGWKAVAPRAAQGNRPKVGTFGDFMIQAYGEQPNAQQYEEGRRLWQQSGASTTIGEHVILVPQPDGSIMPVTVQTTSTKTFGQPGATPTPTPQATPPANPNVPKTPAQAKAQVAPVAPPHAGVVGSGKAVGGRMTPPQVAAKKDYDESLGLSKEVDEIMKSQKAGEPVAVRQKRILVRLERLAAGRFTTQAVQYIQKAGLGNTIQQWINNVDSGELPDGVWRQVVAAVHDYQKGAKATLDASGYKSNEVDPTQKLLDDINKRFPAKKPETKPQ